MSRSQVDLGNPKLLGSCYPGVFKMHIFMADVNATSYSIVLPNSKN